MTTYVQELSVHALERASRVRGGLRGSSEEREVEELLRSMRGGSGGVMVGGGGSGTFGHGAQRPAQRARYCNGAKDCGATRLP